MIVEARKRAGLSQQELADLLGISRSYLSHIEIGRRPPHQLARRLEEILDLAPGSIKARELAPREAAGLESGARVWSSDGRPGTYITTVRGQVVCLYA